MKISNNDRLQAKRVIRMFDRNKKPKEVFYDLCFCICAPQTTFKSNLKVNQSLKDFEFYNQRIPKEKSASYYNWFGELCSIVKPARFYHNKTIWLIEMKQKFLKFISI